MDSDSDIDIENFGQIDEDFLKIDQDSQDEVEKKREVFEQHDGSFNEEDFHIEDLELEEFEEFTS